jgi:hypothetical protein
MNLRVVNPLKRYFSDDVVNRPLACAMYCIGNETSTMNDIDDWMEAAYLPYIISLITSQSSSRLFKTVGNDILAIHNFKKD